MPDVRKGVCDCLVIRSSVTEPLEHLWRVGEHPADRPKQAPFPPALEQPEVLELTVDRQRGLETHRCADPVRALDREGGLSVGGRVNLHHQLCAAEACIHVASVGASAQVKQTLAECRPLNMAAMFRTSSSSNTKVSPLP